MMCMYLGEKCVFKELILPNSVPRWGILNIYLRIPKEGGKNDRLDISFRLNFDLRFTFPNCYHSAFLLTV